MGVRYYLSGCAHTRSFNNNLGNLLIKDITQTNNIVFIAGEPEDHEFTRGSAIWFLKELKRRHVVFDRYHVIISTTPYYLAQRWIKTADMIVLFGGNPLKQKKMCKTLGIYKMLRDFDRIMLGMSAGAMLMSEKIIITPISEEYPDLIIRDGLNKDGISIYPHNNTELDEYPECIERGNGEVYWRRDFFDAYDLAGPFYLLQDIHENIASRDICHQSFIRADGNVVIHYENNGKAWIVNKNDINLIAK